MYGRFTVRKTYDERWKTGPGGEGKRDTRKREVQLSRAGHPTTLPRQCDHKIVGLLCIMSM